MKKPTVFFGILLIGSITARANLTATNSSFTIEQKAQAGLQHSPRHPKPNRPELKQRRTSPLLNRAPDQVGPNSKTWLSNQPGASGAASRLVEVGTGMNYFDGKKWVASEAAFEATPTGFIASKLQHKVKLSGQLNKIGSVEVTTPDGLQLKSTPIAIGFYDAASGKTAFIASIKDSEGVLVSSNAVLYKDAFNENGVSADVLYTLEKGSFEQDVIVTGHLDPRDYGFPAETTRLQVFTEFYNPPQPDRIRRPIRVEANDQVRQKLTTPDLVDEVLGFGEFVLATGRSAGALANDGSSAAPVAKEFRTLDGRHFLIESVEYPNIDTELKRLPAAKTALLEKPVKRKWPVAIAAFPSARQKPIATLSSKKPLMLARDAGNYRQGVVIDYIGTIGGTVSSTTTFQGDTTYFVSSPAVYNGTVIIEGGAVFKFRNSTGTVPTPSTTYIKANGSILCKSSGYLPAVFTAVDDDSVGEFIPPSYYGPGPDGLDGTQDDVLIETGYTGYLADAGPDGVHGNEDDVPKYYGNPYLWVYYINFATLNNLRFSYAQEAVRVDRGLDWNITVAHSQFVNCIRGIVLTGSASGTGSGTAAPLTLKNALFTNVQTPFTANTPTAANWIYHCTIDNSTSLATAAAGCYTTFQFVNSILANVSSAPTGPVTLNGYNNGFYNYTPAQFGGAPTRYTSSSNPFQIVGNGSHYLLSDSSFKQKGSTAIPSTLVTDLKKRTTQAPLLVQYPMSIAGDTFWGQTVARYESGQPDLGFYYDPIDYMVSWLNVGNGRLTVAPGTTIAYLPDISADGLYLFDYGVFLGGGAVLESNGSPTKLNHFVGSDVVQEGHNPWVEWTSYGQAVLLLGGWDAPQADIRFTDFSVLGSFYWWHILSGATAEVAWTYGEVGLVEFQDCQFRSGLINLSQYEADDPGDFRIENTLFERVGTFMYPYSVAPTLDMHNCLFKGGSLTVFPEQATPEMWVIKDNLFDNCLIQQSLDVDADYNAYYPSASTRLSPAGANDQLLATAPIYQTSTLGSYYLPANSTLYDAGSRTPGEAGLYHYTTRITQLKDGEETGTPNNVNIGLHYVACVGVNPKDSDSDGIPDYVEDANGNGVVDDGETNPLLAQTSTGTPDSSNDIYDGVDLDGDGLNGLGERTLGTNPLTQDSLLRLTQVTTGEEPQIITFRTSISESLLPTTGGRLSLSIDGDLSAVQETYAAVDGYWQVAWNTAFSASGTHLVVLNLASIDPVSRVPTDGSSAEVTGVMTGPAFVITTSQDTTMSTYYTGYDVAGYLPIRAFISAPAERYEIAFTDENDIVLGQIDGSIDGPVIETYWDMVKPDESTITDETFNGEIRIFSNSEDSLPRSRTRYVFYPRMLRDGHFTVAHALEDSKIPVTMSSAYQNWYKDMVQWSIVDTILTMPDTVWYESIFNNFSGNQSPPKSGYINTLQLKSDLLDNLAYSETRNFHWDGHGGPGNIGNHSVGPTPPPITIYAMDIENALNNKEWRNGPEYRHPYRFVFLDACEVMKNPFFQTAFGISTPIYENDIDFNSQGPQALLGWVTLAAMPSSVDELTDWSIAMATFYVHWMTDSTVQDAFSAACADNLAFPLNRAYNRNIVKRWFTKGRAAIAGYPSLTRGNGF
jgi:hypothetical protein